MAAAMNAGGGKTAPSKQDKNLEDVGISNLRSQAAQQRLTRYKELKDSLRKYNLLGRIEDGDNKGKLNKDYTPEQFVLDMQQGIYEINDMLIEIGAPFGAAGDTAWFAEARLGWQQIYVQIASMADTLYSLLELKTDEANIPQEIKEDVDLLTQIKGASTIEEVYRITSKAKRNPLQILRSELDKKMLAHSKMELVRSFFTFYQVEYLGWAQFMYDLCWNKEHTKLEWAVTIYQPPSMFGQPNGQGLGELANPNEQQDY